MAFFSEAQIAAAGTYIGNKLKPFFDSHDSRITAIEDEIMPATTAKTTSVSLAAGTAKQIPPAPVANRKSVIMTNDTTEDIWYGDSTVTVGTGTLLRPGAVNALSLSGGLYAICAVAASVEINELY